MPQFTYQQNGYSCGVHALSNALKVLSIEMEYADVKALVGTTARGGTTKAGMIRGIESLGLAAIEYQQKKSEPAWLWLKKWSLTHPVICLVDDRNHWLTITGRINGHVIVVDPTLPWKAGENGVSVAGKEEFLWRWRDTRCYAIRVSR